MKYIVTQYIQKEDKVYGIGEEIELTSEQALVLEDRIKKITDPPKAKKEK